jgi:hypothetical protein
LRVSQKVLEPAHTDSRFPIPGSRFPVFDSNSPYTAMLSRDFRPSETTKCKKKSNREPGTGSPKMGNRHFYDTLKLHALPKGEAPELGDFCAPPKPHALPKSPLRHRYLRSRFYAGPRPSRALPGSAREL